MNLAIKPLYRILKISEVSKILNNDQQRILFSIFGRGNFWIFKKLEYMWKNLVRCICVQNFMQITWKNGWVLVFWRLKRPFFTLFPAISVFSRFSKFVRFGTFKSVLWSFFAFLTKHWTQKHVLRRPNPNFSVWPLLDFVTLNDLDLEYANRKPRMILRSVPDTIHVVALTYFHFIRL